jgi:hypothetical protein
MMADLYYQQESQAKINAGLTMTAPLKYPLGIQTFSEIREENYLYVDKTAQIFDLLTTGKIYFLSRPRRFGKSLLISTLEALFRGHIALFDGLAIAQAEYDYDFATYPVVKLEFSQDEFRTAESLRDYINASVNRIASENNIKLIEQTYNQRFAELVRKLHQINQQKVVLLIDEYDKPILNNFNKPILAEIKQVLSAFYSVIKPLDEHLKFVFITGVSKFSKVSVFSAMNSLTDISMDRQYATLCGITQQELEDHFSCATNKLSKLEQVDNRQILAKIKHWYNGYRFHHLGTSVYNPYSLLSLFKQQEFKNYWFTTGTPTFLLDFLQKKQYELKDLAQFEIGDDAFSSSEPEDMDVLSLFVQTGYLTIKGYNSPLYLLDFPNYEVKKSFFDSIVGRFSHMSSGLGQKYVHHLTQHLITGDLNAFFETLKLFFANIPYDLAIKQEKYYQSLFYAIFTLVGLNIEAEISTNIGRIDCIIQTDSTIYIIEFKLNDTCEAALKQIHDKQYAQKYLGCGKDIMLLGVEFSSDKRNIGEFVQQHLIA